MSEAITGKAKTIKDAQNYLKKLYDKQKLIAKQKKNTNLKDITSLQKYIKTKKEVMEIESIEQDELVKTRGSLKRQNIIQNFSKSSTKFSGASETRLKIAALKEKIQDQEKKIIESEKKLEKWLQPRKTLSNDIKEKISALESEISSSESRLNLLLHCESLSSNPEELSKFAESIKNYSKPIIISNTVKDAWTLAPSEVRDIIKSNHSQIKKTQEKIEEISKLLNEPIEKDPELQELISSAIEKAKQEVNKTYTKKLEKSMHNITAGYTKEIQNIKTEILTLKQSLSLEYLKTHN